MATAEQRPRPIDHVLMADISRLTRNLADYLRILKRFGNNDVDVVAINES